MVKLKNKKKKPQGLNENQCPNCGKILNKGAVFCYACNSFLTCDGKELLSPEKVTDEDIQRLLDQSQEDQKKNDETTRGKISQFTSGMVGICFILMFLIYFFDTLNHAMICMGAMVVFIILTWIISPADKETQLDAKEREEIITKYIAAVECRNIYGSETSFEPDSALPENLILKACFYGSYYSTYEGNRLIQGNWKGYPFRAGHVKLMYSHTQNGYRRTVDVFDGYCMSIDTDMIFPEKISIIEKYLGCLNQILRENKEESDVFYDGFKVKSEHREIAERFLTPELRKNIVLAGRKYAGTLAIILSPDGNIFIAAGGGEDAFAENISAEKIRAAYRKELEFPLKVLDCFSDMEAINLTE